jgi:hypothetical protein
VREITVAGPESALEPVLCLSCGGAMCPSCDGTGFQAHPLWQTSEGWYRRTDGAHPYYFFDVWAGYRGAHEGFDGTPVPEWARHVQISISPTGRSVRVWVDGEETSPRLTRSEPPSGI